MRLKFLVFSLIQLLICVEIVTAVSFISCLDAKNKGNTVSGLYNIQSGVYTGATHSLYCDMTSAGGPWMRLTYKNGAYTGANLAPNWNSQDLTALGITKVAFSGSLTSMAGESTWIVSSVTFTAMNMLANFVHGLTPTGIAWTDVATDTYSAGYLFFTGILGTNGSWTSMFRGCASFTNVGSSTTLRTGGGAGHLGEYIHTSCADYTYNQNSPTAKSYDTLTRVFWVYSPVVSRTCAGISCTSDYTLMANPSSVTCQSPTCAHPLECCIPKPFFSCKQLRDSGKTASGLYYLTAVGTNNFMQIYCDMTAPDGPWERLATKQGAYGVNECDVCLSTNQRWDLADYQSMKFNKIGWSNSLTSMSGAATWWLSNPVINNISWFNQLMRGYTPDPSTAWSNVNSATIIPGYVTFNGILGTNGVWTSMFYGCASYATTGTTRSFRSGGATGHTGEYVHSSCSDYTPYDTVSNSISEKITWTGTKVVWSQIRVDGGYSAWSSCSATCDQGTQTRTCTNPPPSNGGADCSIIGPTVQSCQIVGCPVNCVGGWGSYTCPVTCGSGTATRTCSITTPSANGGTACPCTNGATSTTACTGLPGCPVNCVGSWGSYSVCSSTCGTATKSRTYTITTPASNGGNQCLAVNGQIETVSTGCVFAACIAPVDCVGSWGVYGQCTNTCGTTGTQTRTYTITVQQAGTGSNCPTAGGATESQDCSRVCCPVNGGWSTSFGPCGAVCNGGVQTKTCDNPSPSCNGAQCNPATGSQACNTQACPPGPVNGGWSPYGACSLSCGGGTRERICNSPFPQAGDVCVGSNPCVMTPGLDCIGSNTQPCNTDNCPGAAPTPGTVTPTPGAIACSITNTCSNTDTLQSEESNQVLLIVIGGFVFTVLLGVVFFVKNIAKHKKNKALVRKMSLSMSQKGGVFASNNPYDPNRRMSGNSRSSQSGSGSGGIGQGPAAGRIGVDADAFQTEVRRMSMIQEARRMSAMGIPQPNPPPGQPRNSGFGNSNSFHNGSFSGNPGGGGGSYY